MRYLHKFICTFLCILLALGLFACGDKKIEDTVNEQTVKEQIDSEMPIVDISTDGSTGEADAAFKDVITNSVVSENVISDNHTAENNISENDAAEDNISENDTLDADAALNEENPEENVQPAESAMQNTGFYKKPIDDEIKARITGISYPGTPGMEITYDNLAYVHVLYVDFEGNTQNGELICDRTLADDMLDIFSQLYAAKYQIDKIRLIDEYGGDDDASCADDNTSCFNYRPVTGGKKLSRHAYGRAIDINPYYNPYVTFKNGQPHVLLPATAQYIDRSQEFLHKIDENDLCYKLFAAHGFKWGGYYKNVKDYQHFEK